MLGRPELEQGLGAFVSCIAHSRQNPIIFNRPGEIFYGIGSLNFSPALSIEEKRISLAAVICSKF